MAGDLFILGIYMLGVMFWGWFGYLCIIHRQYGFGTITPLKGMLLTAIVIALAGGGLYLAVIETFERKNEDWWWVAVGVLAPLAGCYRIRRTLKK